MDEIATLSTSTQFIGRYLYVTLFHCGLSLNVTISRKEFIEVVFMSRVHEVLTRDGTEIRAFNVSTAPFADSVVNKASNYLSAEDIAALSQLHFVTSPTARLLGPPHTILRLRTREKLHGQYETGATRAHSNVPNSAFAMACLPGWFIACALGYRLR